VVTLGDVIEYIKVSNSNFQSVDNVTNNDHYENEKQVLQLLIHNKAEQKTAYYTRKISEMKQKYNMDFLTFENRIVLKVERVDFEELNDFILWGNYVKAYRYWEQYVL
jgi:alpha-N-acetylglucosamine transferase